MNTAQAKDFLIAQAAEQAAIDHVALSEIEKRMLYFTEGDDATEDPTSLQEEFEAVYDDQVYEAKMASLFKRAYARLKNDNPVARELWDESVSWLERGDHYILVLCAPSQRRTKTERPPHDILKLIATALLVTTVGLALLWEFDSLSRRYGWAWKSGPVTISSPPTWAWAVFWTAAALAYFNYAILPTVFKRPPVEIVRVIKRIMGMKDQRSH